MTENNTTPAAKFIIACQLDGFPVSVEVEGRADSLRAMIAKLQAIGAEPPSGTMTANTPSASAPVCPIHRTKMKPSRKPGKFYCAGKDEDGEYCKEVA